MLETRVNQQQAEVRVTTLQVIATDDFGRRKKNTSHSILLQKHTALVAESKLKTINTKAWTPRVEIA
jgi:hypothetical protein